MQNPNALKTMARHVSKNLFPFLSVVIYMGLVKVWTATDYWNGSRLYSIGFQHLKCKLLVVPDSLYAYTCFFLIRYEDKSFVVQRQKSNGCSYKAVMALVDDEVLGLAQYHFGTSLSRTSRTVGPSKAFHKSPLKNCPVWKHDTYQTTMW